MKRLTNEFSVEVTRAFVILMVVLTSAGSSLAAVPNGATGAPAGGESGPGAPVVLRADPRPSSHRTPPPARALATPRVQTAEITVNYLPEGSTDAWDAACYLWPSEAMTAFNHAASVWETLVTSSVPIVIDACWAELDEGYLGYGGPDYFYHSFAGAPTPNTWYPVALANALSGMDRNGGDPEIHTTYSRTFDWYFGTDGNTPTTQYDFVSVVLHEIAHGLGFLGSMTWSGGVGSWGEGTPYPDIYDRFTQDGFGNALINTAIYPNPSTALGSALTSNNVWFDGPRANAANDGGRVKLYAPSTWQSGSSYSHLDEMFNDTPNALMTYSLSPGESNHSPGLVAMGILEDIGWVTGDPTPAPTVTSISPSSGRNTGSMSVSIGGTAFQTGASVKLTRGGQADIPGTSVAVIGPSQITCNFDLTGKAVGSWNVVVTNPDTQSGTLPSGFTITAPPLPGEPSTVFLPLVVRRYPPVPAAPNLHPITPNPSTDGNYTVSWSAGSGPAATSYQIEENGSVMQSGYSGTSRSFSGKSSGTYTYRVRGWNAHGYGPWSNARQVAVSRATTELYVGNDTGDRLCYEVYGSGIGSRCFSSGTHFYGSFPSGTYNWHVSAWCGSGSGTRYFEPGPFIHRFWCE